MHRKVITIISISFKVQKFKKKIDWKKFLKWAEQEQILPRSLMLPLYNLNMNSPLVINIQILQLFSCLKCTRQQILSTLRRQRSLATVLPIGTERVSAWVCLSIIMGCRERKREKEWERLLITAYNATSLPLYRPRWVKLSAHSQDQNPQLSWGKKIKMDSLSYVTNRQLWNDMLWAECCLVSFHLYSLNMHSNHCSHSVTGRKRKRGWISGLTNGTILSAAIQWWKCENKVM